MISPGAGLIFSICPPTVTQCTEVVAVSVSLYFPMEAVVISVLIPAAPRGHTHLPGQALTRGL